MWFHKKGFWNGWTRLKFHLSKPVKIPKPRASSEKLDVVSLSSLMPDIPIPNIWMADRIPRDERDLRWRAKKLIFGFEQWVVERMSPMKPGLPPIDDDPHKALRKAFNPSYEKRLPRPEVPEEFLGEPDLGKLAVASPYSCYLERTGEGDFQWDFRQLGRYEHHAGLRSLEVRVLFHPDARGERLHAVRIDSADLGTSFPGDANWPLAKKIALCAATTHMSLVRHLNWVHLTGANALAIATRNCLPTDHPVLRLVWPHMYGTQSSNVFTIIGQLVPKGDYASIFSFTHRGLCRLLEETHDDFDLSRLDPDRDASKRGLLDAHAHLQLPVLENRQELFRVIRAHASRYLRLYYKSDEQLGLDEHFRCWVNELDRLIPRGTLELLEVPYTLAGAARLIAALIYLETVEHESMGTGLWNYQAWTHVQPVRIYRNGQREPLDVYQRLINATFILHVSRTPLMSDFADLMLDTKGGDAMRVFRHQLEKLQRHTQRLDPAPWRIAPRDLEANINA